MSVTLIRSSFDPDPIPEVGIHRFSIGVGVVRNLSVKSLLDASLAFAASRFVPQPVHIKARCRLPASSYQWLATLLFLR